MNGDAIAVSGTVSQLMPNAMFRVDLDNGHQVLAIYPGAVETADAAGLQVQGVPLPRTWRARATTALSSATEAGRWNSGAVNLMLPAQLPRGRAVIAAGGSRARWTGAGRRTTAR